jgi:hypothetical protein
MCTEKLKGNKDESACCSAEQFKGMFEMMSKCFTGDTGLTNFTEIMERMKKTCCGPKKEDAKSEGCS